MEALYQSAGRGSDEEETTWRVSTATAEATGLSGGAIQSAGLFARRPAICCDAKISASAMVYGLHMLPSPCVQLRKGRALLDAAGATSDH